RPSLRHSPKGEVRVKLRTSGRRGLGRGPAPATDGSRLIGDTVTRLLEIRVAVDPQWSDPGKEERVHARLAHAGPAPARGCRSARIVRQAARSGHLRSPRHVLVKGEFHEEMARCGADRRA